MQSEQPRGLVWLLRSNPRLWATVIPIVVLVVGALVTSQLLLPVLPKELRDAFESVDQRANSEKLHVAERIAVKAELRRLAAAAQENLIADQTCEAAIRQIRVVIMEAEMSRGLVRKYVAGASLPDSEKVTAANTIHRYVEAFCQGKVDEQTAIAMEDRTVEVDDEGKRHFRRTLPDDELRALLAAMAVAADKAGIPATVEPIDVTARVNQIVDEALAQPRG